MVRKYQRSSPRDTYGSDWSLLSQKVKERDRYTCRKCRRHKSKLKPHERLEVHHMRRLARAGSNAMSNLLTLCTTCHGKQRGHGHRQLGRKARACK